MKNERMQNPTPKTQNPKPNTQHPGLSTQHLPPPRFAPCVFARDIFSSFVSFVFFVVRSRVLGLSARGAMYFAMTRKRINWIIATIAYVAMIFVLASLAGNHIPQAHMVPHRFLEVLQNALHIPLYAGLAWLLVHAMRGQDLRLSRRATGTIAITALAIAMTDEWIQSHVPGRTASLLDIGLDLIGVLAVLGAKRSGHSA